MAMLKSYFILTWRKARKWTGYFWLNLVGLIIGLSLVELLILRVANALSRHEPWQPSLALAGVILLIVTFGYSNFFSNEVRKRYKEAGLRKLYGAGTGQIVLQFLLESIQLVFLSVLVSLTLAELSEPYFDALYQLSGSIREQSLMFQALVILGLTVWLGLLGSVIPVVRFARISINEIAPNLKLGTTTIL